MGETSSISDYRSSWHPLARENAPNTGCSSPASCTVTAGRHGEGGGAPEKVDVLQELSRLRSEIDDLKQVLIEQRETTDKLLTLINEKEAKKKGGGFWK